MFIFVDNAKRLNGTDGIDDYRVLMLSDKKYFPECKYF